MDRLIHALLLWFATEQVKALLLCSLLGNHTLLKASPQVIVATQGSMRFVLNWQTILLPAFRQSARCWIERWQL